MTQEPDSLITEEMRRAIGVESDPGVIEVEKETIRRVADALGDPNPLWRDEEYAKGTSYGGIIAFPIAFHPSTRAGRPNASYESPARGGVVANDEWEFFEPVRPGDRITVTTKVVDFFEREGRQGKDALHRHGNHLQEPARPRGDATAQDGRGVRAKEAVKEPADGGADLLRGRDGGDDHTRPGEGRHFKVAGDVLRRLRGLCGDTPR